MELSEIIVSVGNLLSEISPVYQEFDEKYISSKERDIILTGLKELKTEKLFSGNSKTLWNAVVSVSIMCREPCSGATILKISDKVIKKLVSSSLDIVSYKACALYYDEKTDRLCYCLEISLKGVFDTDFVSEKSEIALSLSENLTISVSDFIFERKRVLSDISITGGFVTGDKGNLPLAFSARGKLLSDNDSSVAILENLLCEQSILSINFLGNLLPPMVLKNYSYKGDGASEREIEVTLTSKNNAERVTGIE